MSEHNDLKPLLMQHIHGIDHLKEIFDLWYELSYIRFLLGEVLLTNPGVRLLPESLEKARALAQDVLKEKFPTVDLDYRAKTENTEKETT